jgi:hypothetical protein
MNTQDKKCFDNNYKQPLKCLKLQGKADKTIQSYSRALRRVTAHFNCLPETLTPDDLKDYFAALVESHSWSTVKIDRLGLQFYWRHVLYKDWQWIDIVGLVTVVTGHPTQYLTNIPFSISVFNQWIP